MLARVVFVLALVSCVAARTAHNGWVTETIISGTSLLAAQGFAWDDQGYLYVSDAYTSAVAKIPSSALPVTNEGTFTWKKIYSGNSDQANGLIFKDGRLYMTQLNGDRIVEIDPLNGDVKRTVTTAISGPIDMHIDPISGDVFVSALHGAQIHRIKNIGTTPVVSTYARFNSGIDGFSFSADGTIYACVLNDGQVWKAYGTNITTGPAPAFFFNKVHPDGNAVASCNGVESLIVDSASNGQIHSVPLNNPAGATIIVDGVSAKMDLARVGPDGKFYISMHYDNNTVRAFRLFNTGCTFTTDPSTEPGNFPGSSSCGPNCVRTTAGPACGAVNFSSSGKCASLSFSAGASCGL